MTFSISKFVLHCAQQLSVPEIQNPQTRDLVYSLGTLTLTGSVAAYCYDRCYKPNIFRLATAGALLYGASVLPEWYNYAAGLLGVSILLKESPSLGNTIVPYTGTIIFGGLFVLEAEALVARIR